jgi:hypothetical protein
VLVRGVDTRDTRPTVANQRVRPERAATLLERLTEGWDVFPAWWADRT